MFRRSLVCLVSFIAVMQIVPQDYIMRDNLAIDSSLSTVVKQMKEIQ